MIRQVVSIVVMSSLFVSCSTFTIFTVKDIGGGKYYVEGILPNDAIRKAQEFCNKQNKEVADEIESVNNLFKNLDSSGFTSRKNSLREISNISCLTES